MSSLAPILVVEDSPIQAELLKRLLVAEGYTVQVAVNGQHGLDTARTPPHPALVVSDIAMPEMDGYTLCALMKQDAALRAIPVILLTTLSDSGDVIRGINAGADAYITKPYNAEQLLARIAALLRHPAVAEQADDNDQAPLLVTVAGERYEVQSERRQILNLLISTYENAVAQNQELRKTQEELRSLNEKLEDEVELRTAKNKAILLQVIEAIALAVEQRDPYISGHQRRVADLAAAIGKELGLPPSQVEGIFLAGLIHDIGKIAVPAEILNRPGRLNEHEFALIKDHAEHGYIIVRNIEFPWPLSDIIHQHHERLDGSGYPCGLRGEAVLLEARIISVADVMEAISNLRPYREALGVDAALEEIKKFRGTHFDPDAVDACVRLFTEKGYTFPS